MTRSSWRHWLARTFGRRALSRRLPAGQRWRPIVERLESRTVPVLNLLGNFTGLNFGQTQGFVPPDTCGAAGTAQFVETVNQTIKIFNKTTGAALANDNFDHFFFTTGGLSRADGGSGLSDPIITWDEQVQRFIVGDQDVNFGTHVSTFDIAISKSATPTTLGTSDWNFYRVVTTEAGLDADYPGNFGWNADAFVFTLNMFPATSGSFHVQVTSVNMQDLVNGVAQASLRVFHNDFNGGSLRPTVMHDSVAGDPMWLVEEAGDGQHIRVVKMTGELSNSATFNSTNVTVNTYTGIGSLGRPRQPNGATTTTNIDSRIIKAAEFGGKLVAAHAVTTASGDRDFARWYEFDVSSGTPSLVDQGNVTSATTGAGSANVYDVYPGIDISPDGQIGMSFMQSSHTGTNQGEFVSVYTTVRAPWNAPGTMQTPILVQAGVKNYSDFTGGGRQGDLSGISVDTDGSFWAVNEFADGETSGANWGTAVGHFVDTDLLPVAVINGPYNVNEGSSITLSSAGSFDPDGSISTYEWDFNYVAANGFNVTATGPSPTFDATNIEGPLVRTIALRVKDNEGAPSPIATTTLTVNDITPTISLSGPTSGIEGSTFNYTAAATDFPTDLNGAVYTWTITRNGSVFTNFTGQGTTAISFDDPDVLAIPDVFNINVVVLNNDGILSAPASTTLTVDDPLPTVGVSGPTSGVEGATSFTFTATPSDTPADLVSAFYNWTVTQNGNSFTNFVGQGSSSITFSDPDTAANPDVFNVSVTVTNDDGLTSAPANTTLTVADPPPTVTVSGPTSGVEGSSFSYSATAADTPVDLVGAVYTWTIKQNGNAFTNFTGQGASAISFSDPDAAANPDVFDISVTVTNNDGLTSAPASTSLTVIDPPPTVNVSGPTSGSEGSTFSYTATASDLPADLVGAVYTWTITRNGNLFTNFTGQGTTGISFDDPDVTGSSDAFNVSVRVRNNDGLLSAPASVSLTVNDIVASASFSNTGPVAQTDPVKVQFTNIVEAPAEVAALRFNYDLNGNGVYTDPGDILNSTATSVTLTFANPGDYTINGQMTTEDGIVNNYSTTIHVNKLGNGGKITTPLFAVGADVGGTTDIRVYDRLGSLKFTIPTGFPTGGARVATGDINGDGVDDIVAGTGPGVSAQVKVFSGVDGSLLRSYSPYPATFKGGVYLAAGDVNHDFFDDVLIAPGPGAALPVYVYSGRFNSLMKTLTPFGKTTNGVTIAAADVNGDGFKDIIAGQAKNGSTVTVIDAVTNKAIWSFSAFGFITGGVTVAGGDVNGDGRADLILGMGAQTGQESRVRVIDGRLLGSANPKPLYEFVVYAGFQGGVRVATEDLDGDGKADLLIAPGPGYLPSFRNTPPNLLGLRGTNLVKLLNFAPLPKFLGGIYVG